MKAILTFHSIDDSDSALSYSPALFKFLLGWLSSKGIPVLSINELLAPGVDRGVALTFDDGMQSVYSNALPILRDYNATAHVFVTTRAVGSDLLWPKVSEGVGSFEMLSWGQIEALHNAGIIIDAHTCTHPDMRELTVSQLEDQCSGADEDILTRLGRRPENFAYPFGFHNQVVRDYVRGKYKATVTTELSYLSDNEDLAALPRLDTYYFQSEKAISQLNSFFMKSYVKTRGFLRNVRGSQCRADCL